MGKITPAVQKIFYLVLLLCCVKIGKGQTLPTLKFIQYAIWGGSASANSYKQDSGVVFNNTAKVQGNIGSNHLVDMRNNMTVTGSIYSGNLVIFKDYFKITGNVVANTLGTTLNPGILGGNRDTITGNLMSRKITLGKTGVKVTGIVYVPAPTATNYTGPTPSGGFQTSFTPPSMPSMPNINNFDYLVAANTAANNITSPTSPLQPGVYRKLALTGNKTLTFDGPGNYIFYEVDNGNTTNKIVFDFKGTTDGTINIFVIKDARWGSLSVTMKNGNDPGRIYTEVHGTGSTFGTGYAYAFELQGASSAPAGSNLWLGNVWVPFVGINFVSSPLLPVTTPHMIGTLWSGKKVNIKNDFIMVYKAPTFPDLGFVDPYYSPPVDGKTDEANNSTGPELLALSKSKSTDSIRKKNNNDIFVFKANDTANVLIEVISKEPNDLLLKQDLIDSGMLNENYAPGTIDNGPHSRIISGYYSIKRAPFLINNPRVKYVRPLYPPLSNKEGQVGTQGDTTMKSFVVRDRFGANGPVIDGTGVKIGVISDSYNTNAQAAADDVAQGDLPADVQVLGPQIPGTDEGRAMLQIVHDIAPKAKLAVGSGSLGAGPMANTILQMASPSLPGGKCDVIVDDLTFLTEPFQRDGIVAQTVNTVVRDFNVVHVTSGGNFGRQGYEAAFNGVLNANVKPGVQFHNFENNNSPNKIYQNLNLKPGSYTIVLQWEDGSASLGDAGGVQTDLDLYLLSAAGFIKFGFNRISQFLDPYEVCAFTVREETNVKLVVARAVGTRNVRFKYIIFRGDATILDYTTGNTSTIVGHSNSDSAITVGAMLYANIPQYTPVWPGVASFSSRGGTLTVTDPTSPNPTYTQRFKPDIIAANGVNTTVTLGGVNVDGDPYPNFFGTSAAAPHVAAVAGLLIQSRRFFNLQTAVPPTPSEIRLQLRTSAGKFAGQTNHSYEGGYGFVQADSAMLQIANARPTITSLEAVVAGAQNGTDSFFVKLKGQYLNDSTKIYVGGEPMKTTVLANKTEATAKVAAIPAGQDPAFQLFNKAKSVSGLDGGLSEAKFFFSSRVNITIRAENKSRKYGFDNPAFTVQILRDGVLVTSPDSIAKYKLDGTKIKYKTIATSSSRAAFYGIFPERETPLASNDPLLTNYQFTFVSGTLTVEKMHLTITPLAKTVKYGEDLGEISYTYDPGPSVTLPPALLNEIKDLHKQHLADNAVIAIDGFNGQTSALSNMSAMASLQALRNGRRFIIEDGVLTPLTDPIDDSQLGEQRFVVDVAAQSLTNYITDPASAPLVASGVAPYARGLLNIKPLANGTAKATVPGGTEQPIVNGQLLSMVNGQLKSIVNGQPQSLVDGQLMPLVNGNLVAMVNGQLQTVVNGQLFALVNGQLMAPDDNGDLQIVQNLTILSNTQLSVLLNGQLRTIVNGQLKAIVNGIYTDVSFVNGQLKAIVNGVDTDLFYANGQLKSIVNGQLKSIVNGAEVGVESAQISSTTGQTQVEVDNTFIPIANGQLQALVNSTVDPDKSQLLSMTNGQLMAIVNGELTFVVFQNGQLKAIVNGQLETHDELLTNGQLKAIVNGLMQPASGAVVNGQLKAIVNGEDWVYENGQLKAIVNGQLKSLVNNFDVSGTNNNSKTVVIIDEDDINLQYGDIGGMFSVNMITGLTAGAQKLVPGAFVNENFEVTYGLGDITISPTMARPAVTSKAVDSTLVTSAKIITREDKLFPNPTTNSLRLILNQPVGSTKEIQVVDITGRVQSVRSRKSSEGNYDINVSGLADGVYFIRAKTPVGFKTFRFIKM
jgi:hypothetical protein